MKNTIDKIIGDITAGRDKFFGLGHFHNSNMADYTLMSNTINDMVAVYDIDEVEAGLIIEALLHN